MTAWQTKIITDFPTLSWQLDFDLSTITYFKLGGVAELFLDVDTLVVLQHVLVWCQAENCPVTVLGGASNVVVSDKGIDGIVIRVAFREIVFNTEDPHRCVIGAGCKTATAVRQVIQAGLSGLEYFLGVPGTIGGAIFNNAHYMEHLISEYVTRVQVVDIEDGYVQWLDAEQCDFEYDHSRFQTSNEIIWAVEFRLPDGDEATSQALIKQATQYRASTQPLGVPSSGCIFQNPPNTDELKSRFPQFAHRSHVPAGFLIDHAGLKGTRIGDIEVSQVHAAFMVNTGNGTAQQVKDLIELVKKRVFETFGVHLQEEVFYLGTT